jgi:hypothetical protein
MDPTVHISANSEQRGMGALVKKDDLQAGYMDALLSMYYRTKYTYVLRTDTSMVRRWDTYYEHSGLKM